MEGMDTVKKAKTAAKVAKTEPVRVAKETRRRILSDLARLNKKEHGRQVRADDLIALALTLVTPEHHTQLQDATLSNADRLQRRYLAYIKDHGAISKDAFLGKLLSENLAQKSSSNVAPGASDARA